MVRRNFWPYSGVILSKGSNVMGKRKKLWLVLAGLPFRVNGRCRKWRQELDRTWANRDTVKKFFWLVLDWVTFWRTSNVEKVIRVEINKIWENTKSYWSTMFEQLCQRDDTCLEHCSDDDALSSTSLADRDVTTAMRATLNLPRRVTTAHSCQLR